MFNEVERKFLKNENVLKFEGEVLFSFNGILFGK
jgi:hypothetical protein